MNALLHLAASAVVLASAASAMSLTVAGLKLYSDSQVTYLPGTPLTEEQATPRDYYRCECGKLEQKTSEVNGALVIFRCPDCGRESYRPNH